MSEISRRDVLIGLTGLAGGVVVSAGGIELANNDASQSTPKTPSKPTPGPSVPTTREQAETDKLIAEAEQLRNPFKTPAGITAAVGALAAFGGGIGWLHKRRQDRQERKEATAQVQEEKAREQQTKAEEAFKALVEDILSDQPDKKQAAAVNLLTYTAEKYADRHEQIFDLTVGLLQQRAVDMRELKPDFYYQHIIRAFLQVIPPLRAKKLQQRQEMLGDAFSQETLWSSTLLSATNLKLDGANLAGEDLSYIDLSNSSAQGANADFAVFKGVDLRNADFREAQLKGAHFSHIDGRGMQLDETGAWGRPANLYQASFAEVDFSGIHLGETPPDIYPTVLKDVQTIDGTKGLREETIAWLAAENVPVNSHSNYTSAADKNIIARAHKVPMVPALAPEGAAPSDDTPARQAQRASPPGQPPQARA